MALTPVQKQRVSDCVDSLKLLAIPEKWKAIPGFPEQAGKSLVNVMKGLQAVGVGAKDVEKALECISYGRPDLAYKYLFESSKIKDPTAEMLDARMGKGGKKGALKDLYELLVRR